MTRAFYVTTPIYYVNGSPHVGHAYTTLACDVLARFMRLDGCDVKFLSGTDEHGQKVERTAEAAGMTPQAFADKVEKEFREMAKAMKATCDDFIRTSEPRHKKGVTKFWERLVENDDLYLGSYSGWYSVTDETFFAEKELINGKAPTGANVEWVEEPSYFFRLSKYQDRLLKFYNDHPDFIAPASRRNEVISFVKQGLIDLSVSRTTFTWGVPVPGDPDHVVYVWLDALTNYITALGYPDTEASDFATFWPEAHHIVGKDILRFHAIFWPAFLMAADLPLPKRVYAHGWWTNEGQKCSKSLGNVLDPFELIKTYGVDQLRYFMMREIPFGQDGDFSCDSMERRINSDLANDYGNLIQRVLSFVAKHAGGVVPKKGTLTRDDEAMLKEVQSLYDDLKPLLAEEQAFHKYLERLWRAIGVANRYVDTQAPWALRKTDTDRMETVLYVLSEAIRYITILAQPFLPDATEKILDQLAVPKNKRTFANLSAESALVSGTALPNPEPIFPRYVPGGSHEKTLAR